MPEAGFELVPIHVNGTVADHWTLISAAYDLERARCDCTKRFKEQGAPDVAGAYVGAAFSSAFAKATHPYLIHEQNSGNRSC